MVLVREQQILMVRQSYKGEILWTFPGGAIEPGESPAAAAVRETREEVHLATEITQLLYQGPRRSGIGLYYCYLGKILDGLPKLGVDPELPGIEQELLELKWWPMGEVTDHPEVMLILGSLTGEIKKPSNTDC